MKTRGLLFAAVVLAALSGVLYWSNRRKPAEPAAKPGDTPPKILDLKQDDITKVEIRKAGKPELTLEKADGSWKLTQPAALSADQQAVSSLASSLAPLSAERLIEDKASDLAPFGLASPSLELTVTSKDARTNQLLIGGPTPTRNAYYAKLAADPRVFTIASYNENSLDKTANDLRDKRLLTFDLDKASQIEVAHSGQSITFGRSKDGWQILKPHPWRADSSAVDSLIQTLRDAKMDTSMDQKDAASRFNAAKTEATVKVTGPGGSQTLQIRKDKTDYFAKSSAVEGAYKVAVSLPTGLDKKVDDYRDKKLFSFGFNTPDKIEIHDGGKSYFLTHADADWWGPDGKKLDADSAQEVLDKLRDLVADKFPDSGFSAPSIRIIVTSDGGKTVDNVLIAQNGNSYVGKRDGEAALYGIEPVVVTEIQKAAAGLKPATPPAPEKKK